MAGGSPCARCSAAFTDRRADGTRVAEVVKGARLAAGVLWETFSTSRDARTRSELIEHYMPFAKMIAAKVYGMSGAHASNFDDYLQYARVGLIEAVDRFDAARGVSFEAYAVHRVRGAVLNGVSQESEIA